MYKLISAKRLSNGAGGHDIYTKSGQVRKDCTIKEFDGTPEQAKEWLQAVNFRPTGKPYVFTCIVGEDILGNKAIVTQDCNGFMVSPVKLGELLGV